MMCSTSFILSCVLGHQGPEWQITAATPDCGDESAILEANDAHGFFETVSTVTRAILILLVATIAAAVGPLPQPKVGQCPAGYRALHNKPV
jgi:hypothetical protein